VAITDILERIAGDASAEAGGILDAARTEAARIAADAEATVARERAELEQATERDAADAAATVLANARLAARDALLAAKRALAEEVLVRVQAELEAMPDAAYCEFLASAVAAACSGGETIALAPADSKRLSRLPARLGELGCAVVLSSEPASIERGVVLTGDRMRVEVSPASLVEDRREELLLVAARALFGEGE
jgi:vacuolar-type H+-ATPase subunit E/Vma4